MTAPPEVRKPFGLKRGITPIRDALAQPDLRRRRRWGGDRGVDIAYNALKKGLSVIVLEDGQVCSEEVDD
jgi:hypothetical protein